MKKLINLLSAIGLLIAAPLTARGWIQFLDGSSLPQNNGWLLDASDPGTIVALGGGNSGFRQSDDTTAGYDEWYVVNTNQASTLAARFRVDSYAGGPVNILQLTTANSGGNPCPFIAVAIREEAARFNDLPAGDNALDGTYAGLDWGSGLWRSASGAWAGITSPNAYQGASGAPSTGRISGGAGGVFLLKSLRATADSAWTLSLTDNNGQTATLNLTANTPATLTTSWTTNSDWVDVTSSVGYNAVIDDVTYLRNGPRFSLIRVLADSVGAPGEWLADLGPVQTGVFNEAYLYIDNATDTVRLFWNGGLRYTGVDTLDRLGTGEGYAEFGASNYWPDGDRSGISTVTFDWVGLGNAGDLPLVLPFIPWSQYLDGSTLPAPPWLFYQDGGTEGGTVVTNFLDPLNGATNQALQINSGANSTEWYVGAFSQDEVFGGARFRLVDFSPTGKENLIALTTVSQPLAPAPSITLVDGRYKLWSYVDPPFGVGNPGTNIMDLGPAVTNEFHTAYLYAKKDGTVKLWWDGALIFDGIAPLVSPADGYFEWGSGSWQYDATDTVDFDWVAYGSPVTLPPSLATVPANGAAFQNAGAGFSFTNTSGIGVASNGVSLAVNRVNRTSDLVISGNDNIRQGFLGGLVPNQFYQIGFTVTDLATNVFTYTLNFDTFSQSNFMFEAEDWNFDGGQWLDAIVLSSTPGPNNYLDRAGTEDIDQNELSTVSGASRDDYRLGSLVGTEESGDILRQKYIDAQMTDPAVTNYNVGWVEVGEWLNYTRTFPAGTYYIFGRFANGNIGQFSEATMDKVTGATTTSQTVTPLGAFRFGPGRGWQTYNTVPLTDAQTNLLAVGLSGVKTLRVTSIGGGYNADYYLLLPVPVLDIALLNGKAVVSWQTNLPGFVLQFTTNLAPANWVNVTNPVAVVNERNTVTNDLSSTSKFFRLRQ